MSRPLRKWLRLLTFMLGIVAVCGWAAPDGPRVLLSVGVILLYLNTLLWILEVVLVLRDES